MIDTVIFLFFLFFSIVVHEFCHGYAALKNGDDTARLMGRLTLNPIPHIDPIGTLLIPLMLVLTRSRFFIGWARPVPINPLRFRNYEKGMITVGLAGPASNLALGTVLAVLCRLAGPGSGIGHYLLYGGYINFTLAFFNLVPVPPLDGSQILAVFLPFNTRLQYQMAGRFGFLIITFLLLSGFLGWLFPLSAGLANIIAGVRT